MKIVFIALFAASSLFASASGTKEKKVASYHLTRNFTAQFGYVEDVTWSSARNNMTKAEFEADNEKVCAYFDESGNYVAQTTVVEYDELPKNLQSALKEKAPSATFISAFKMISQEETAWFIETTASDEHKVWKGNAFGKLKRYYVQQ